MADEWDEPAADDDETTEGRPSFLDKGPRRPAVAAAANDEWDTAPVDVPKSIDPVRTLKNTGPDFAGQMSAAAAANEKFGQRRSLAERARDTVVGLKDTAVGGARAVGGALPEELGGRGVLNTLKDPAHRREFERGLSDMITLGYAEKAGNAAGRFFAEPEGPDDNVASRVLKRGANAVGLGGQDSDIAANAQADRESAPDDRSLGRAVGMASPGAGTYIAKSAGKVLAPVLSDIQATTRAGGAALGAAKGVAGYAAAAPATAALSAGAAGDRSGAALDALTDPVGLASSAIGGAVAEPIAKNLVDNAKSRATKDIAHDIIAAEGPRARRTDQTRIAEVNDRVFEMTKDLPELRPIWREPAEKAVPKIAAIKERVAEPLDAHYDVIDQATGGGIRLGDIVDGYRAKAKELGKSREGLEDAARLNKLADQELLAAKNRQGDQVKFDPKIKINDEGTTAGDQVAMLEKSADRAERAGRGHDAIQLRSEAENVRAMASKPAGVDLDERIPTKDFRRNVTDLHNTANDVMGSIEGTPRYEAAQRLYSEAKTIIDKHLDSSGVDPKQIAEVRKINDRYFLLSRAEEAIKSRGAKEASRPAFDQLIHSPRRALTSGAGLGTLGTAVVMSHSPLKAAVEIGGALAVGHAAPAVASRVNWKLANLDPTAAQAAVQNIGPNVGLGVGRAVGSQAGPQASDRLLAQLIQGAQAGGNPDDLLRQAKAWGIDPSTAGTIIRRFAPAQQQAAP